MQLGFFQGDKCSVAQTRLKTHWLGEHIKCCRTQSGRSRADATLRCAAFWVFDKGCAFPLRHSAFLAESQPRSLCLWLAVTQSRVQRRGAESCFASGAVTVLHVNTGVNRVVGGLRLGGTQPRIQRCCMRGDELRRKKKYKLTKHSLANLLLFHTHEENVASKVASKEKFGLACPGCS